ncbi:endonuclease III domain-containing protein [Thiocystis violacea]|uniref:endonuclease III domain-containing protein n=1 Tax=Thiocystis violacea TaxID=13725 RepID=UPI001F5BF7D2|nr:endonuclease III domain-containing protein [Thiocystis violacea]
MRSPIDECPLDAERARRLFSALIASHGPRHWWPADSPFEVMIGAVLTQNTAWSNVERALARLKERVPLEAEAILALAPADLAEALRPAGYFNLKARRLTAFCDYYRSAGGLDGLSRLETHQLRQELLAVKGIGPETADDMLLYAFDRPVFVVDAYTRRILSRLGLLAGDEGYESIRAAFERALGPDVPVYKEYHALIVHHGKHLCRTRPRCPECGLRASCPTAPDFAGIQGALDSSREG